MTFPLTKSFGIKFQRKNVFRSQHHRLSTIFSISSHTFCHQTLIDFHQQKQRKKQLKNFLGEHEVPSIKDVKHDVDRVWKIQPTIIYSAMCKNDFHGFKTLTKSSSRWLELKCKLVNETFKLKWKIHTRMHWKHSGWVEQDEKENFKLKSNVINTENFSVKFLPD